MKRKTTSTPSHKITLKGVVEEARTPVFFLLGMFGASQLGKLIDKQVTPAVSGLLGLDGASAQYIKPSILLTGGLVLSKMTSNKDVKMAGYGVASAGGIILAKHILNVDILPLSGVGETRELITGMGEALNLPMLEGSETFIEGMDYPEETEVPIS